MASIIDIEGIGPEIAGKLRNAGVRSTTALLDRAGTAKGRKELSAAIGIDESRLLQWVNHADLFRVSGIGSEYSDLLECAGVDTIPELKQRNASALYDALVSTNEAKKLVRKLPTKEQVAGWIKQAKSLPRVVEY
jgi:predicted flap endonuclease-1-like 5' DNA nuclease